MKIQQAAFKVALDLAAKVMEKSTNPAHALLRLTQGTDRNNLELVAVSPNGGLRLTMAAALDEKDKETPLDLCVSTQTLADLAAEAPTGADITLGVVKVNASARKMKMAWPNATSQIVAVLPDAASVHVRPSITEAQVVSLDAEALQAGLSGAVFAVAPPTDARPLLRGINLRLNGIGEVNASNGFHLVRKTFVTPEGTPEVQATLPVKFVQLLIFLVSAIDVDQPVKLSFTKNLVIADYGGVTIWTSKVEGKYPDLSGIFPKTFGVTVTAKQGQLMRLVKLAKTINQTEGALQLRENAIAIYTENAEAGNAHPVGSVVTGQGSLDVFVNIKYILDAIRSFGHGDLAISGNGPGTAVVISPDASTKYVLMPLNAAGRKVPEPQLDLFAAASVAAEEDAVESEVADDNLYTLASASQSVERITKGACKKPFTYKGRLYVAAGGGAALDCYRVVPEADYQGPKTTYEEASKARGQGQSLTYAGLIVACGAKKYAITDDVLKVKRATEPAAEAPAAPAPGQAALVA